MALQKDNKGHVYGDVANVRITYIKAGDRALEQDWPGLDIIRIQSYRKADTKLLYQGAEFPIQNSEALDQFMDTLRAVYKSGKKMAK